MVSAIAAISLIVGNDDAGDSLRLELPDQIEQWAESSSLRAAVGSSRISSLTRFRQCLGDLDELLLPTPMSMILVSGCSFKPTRASRAAAACWSAPS